MPLSLMSICLVCVALVHLYFNMPDKQRHKETHKDSGWKHHWLAVAGDKKFDCSKPLTGNTPMLLGEWNALVGLATVNIIWDKKNNVVCNNTLENLHIVYIIGSSRVYDIHQMEKVLLNHSIHEKYITVLVVWMNKAIIVKAKYI